MPDFSKRSDGIEIMDDLNCSGDVVAQTLVELEFINKWLGGNDVTLSGLKLLSLTFPEKKDGERLKIVDLGCGGGDMLKLLSRHFRKKKQPVQLIGVDANPNIIAYAWVNSSDCLDITYETLDILSNDFKFKRYDIVFATLFFHHFTSAQLIEIFTSLKKQTRVGIVINDLHRHWLAYYSIKFLTSLFSKSSMVRNDAPLSVMRGFSKNELKEILYHAGIDKYSLEWKWAFRWQLVITFQ
jgi:2-polyprenyl-3-methyl-5-hydroxy-6-metoxy-1,4-benzoquinol methylase